MRWKAKVVSWWDPTAPDLGAGKALEELERLTQEGWEPVSLELQGGDLTAGAFKRPDPNQRPTQWVFHEEVNPNAERMNDLGAEGWEMVSNVLTPYESGGETHWTEYVRFKRPKT